MALNRLGANSQIGYEPPQKSILQVVLQLASRYPPYRRLLTKELADDPMIPRKSPRILFKRLIVEPWDTLVASHPLYLQRPPLIILESLWNPACARHTDTVQVLIGLVQEYSSRHKTTPLLWLICSHPNDRQLNQFPLAIDIIPVYEHEAWTYRSAEAKQDVNDVLHLGFQCVRQDHPTAFVKDEKWPLDIQLDRLANIICGISYFACAVVQFVNAKGKGPKKRLETCIKYMTNCPPPSALNPFSGLDHFYHQIFSNLPPDALDILRLSVRNTCSIANLLRIDRIKFYDFISDNLGHVFTLQPRNDSEYGHVLLPRNRAFNNFFQNAAPLSDNSLVRLSLPYIPRYGAFSAIVNEMTWKPPQLESLWIEAYWLRREVGELPWLAASCLKDGGYDHLSKFDFRHLVPVSAKLPGFWFYHTLLRLKVTLSQPTPGIPTDLFRRANQKAFILLFVRSLCTLQITSSLRSARRLQFQWYGYSRCCSTYVFDCYSSALIVVGSRRGRFPHSMHWSVTEPKQS